MFVVPKQLLGQPKVGGVSNFVNDTKEIHPNGYRRDSRIEIILEGDQMPDIDMLEAQLRTCIAAELHLILLEILMIFILFSCKEEVIKDPPSIFDVLKIEEVYYSGSIPTAGIDRYYSDQFIQLRNTSEHTLDIGGIGIGDIFGLAGEINSGYGPNSYASDADYLYFENLWQIPMESSHRYLEPMGCIKIAQDAADHNPYSPLSHFDAHFETYVEMSEQDKDDPVVENLESIYYSAGYDLLVTVFGPTIAIVDSAAIDEGEVQKIEGNDLWVTPSYHTIDTMEALWMLIVDLSNDYIRILIAAFSMFQEPILENLFEETRRMED